jgi:hypothetical protein
MYSERDLSAEIRALIEKKIETAKRPISPDWIAHEIILRRKPVIVRVENMTDCEIEAKARDLELLSFGARRHARELRRYVRTRPSRRQG